MGCGGTRVSDPFHQKVEAINKDMKVIDDKTKKYEGKFDMKNPEFIMSMMNGPPDEMKKMEEEFKSLEPLSKKVITELKELDTLYDKAEKDNDPELKKKDEIRKDMKKTVPLKVAEYFLRPFNIKLSDDPNILQGLMANLGKMGITEDMLK